MRHLQILDKNALKIILISLLTMCFMFQQQKNYSQIETQPVSWYRPLCGYFTYTILILNYEVQQLNCNDYSKNLVSKY